MKRYLLAIGLITALSPLPASAQLLLGVTYNSGYVGSTPIAPGVGDSNFSIISGPSEALPPTVTQYPITPVVPFAGESPSTAVYYTAQNGTNAQFISPSGNQSYPSNEAGNSPGDYVYQTMLTPTLNEVGDMVTLTGSYSADNFATLTLTVDGTTLDLDSNPDYHTLTPFSLVPISFLLNTPAVLKFTVTNSPDPASSGINPTALLVSNLKFSTTVTPEPSTWAMMFVGLGVLVALRRLRGGLLS